MGKAESPDTSGLKEKREKGVDFFQISLCLIFASPSFYSMSSYEPADGYK